jgi:hypothetical protein
MPNGKGDSLSADCQPCPADILEGAPQYDLDDIVTDWAFLAARAYRNFVCDGPGTLVITVGRNNRADLDFLSAAEACPCCKHLIQPYDPDSQVVLAVRRGGNENVYVLSGFFTPKDAHENAPAEMFDEVLH